MGKIKEMFRSLGVGSTFYLNPGDSKEWGYNIRSGILPIKRRLNGSGDQIVAGKNRRGWVTVPGHQIFALHRGKRLPFPPNPNIPTFLWAAEGETSKASNDKQ